MTCRRISNVDNDCRFGAPSGREVPSTAALAIGLGPCTAAAFTVSGAAFAEEASFELIKQVFLFGGALRGGW